MPSRIFPTTALEQVDIDLCRLEHMVYALQNKGGGGFPIYDETQLPRDIIEGQAFLTEQGRFCVRHGESIFCMPSRTVYGAIGPTLCAVDLETVSEIDSFGNVRSNDIWRPGIVKPNKSYDYVERPGEHDLRWTCINPVWNYAFDKIAYLTWGPRPGQITAGTGYSNPTPPMYVAITDVNTGQETLVYQYSENAGKLCFSPDGKKLAFSAIDTNDEEFTNTNQLYQRTYVYELETGIIHRANGMNYALFDWSKDSEYIYADAGLTGTVSTIQASRWNDFDDWYIILEASDTPDGNAWWTLNTHPDGEHVVTTWFPPGPGDFGLMALIATDGSKQIEYIDVHNYDWPVGTLDNRTGEPYPLSPTQPFFRPDNPDWIIFDSEAPRNPSVFTRTWDAYALNYITGETKRWSIGSQNLQHDNPAGTNPPYSSYGYAVGFGLDGISLQIQNLYDPTDEDRGDGDIVAFDWDTGEGRRITDNHLHIVYSDHGNNYVGTEWYVWWHTGIPWQTYWSNNGAWS
jgi:hypothetical protein